MRIFSHFERLPAELRRSAVAVGNFDGVHRGHQAVINEAGRIARAEGVPWAVMTFEPHPRSVFKPDTDPFRLTPFPHKARLIEALGPQVMIVIRFTMEFSRISARRFVDEILVRSSGAEHVICGHNFAFGHGREGNPENLLQWGGEFGFDFTCVREVGDDGGEPFSSTRIRKYLKDGKPVDATRLLGRPFEIESTVTGGDQRGRAIGFPTANLPMDDYLCPALGVYAIRATTNPKSEAFWLDGVANLGVRPTFGGNEIVLEAHIFDYEGDLYGKKLCVRMIDHLRPEKKFDGIDHLKAQIAEDCARARQILSTIDDSPACPASTRQSNP